MLSPTRRLQKHLLPSGFGNCQFDRFATFFEVRFFGESLVFTEWLPLYEETRHLLVVTGSGRALLRGHAVQHVGHKRQPIGHITQQRFDIGGVLFHHCTGTAWIG